MSHLPIAYPVAVGAALAYKRRGDRRIAMAICGDGSTSNGRWHEAINTSAIHRLPVVWVVNNNQFAYSTPNALEFPMPTIAERAAAYGIPGVRVDGGEVLEVYEAAKRGGRSRARGRRSHADRVRLPPLARPRRARPGEVRARRRCSRTHMANHDPVKNFEAWMREQGRHARRRRSPAPGTDRAGVRRGSRVRARLPVPRARRRLQGELGRGRLLDVRAGPRRRHGGS